MGFGKKKKVGVEDADSQKSTSDYVLQLPRPLNVDEKKYLLAVERGDLANVTRMLQIAQKDGNMRQIDINCVDSFGRSALTLAIESENLEMVKLLIVMGVETKDALLHAISEEFVEAVELLLEYEELISYNNNDECNKPNIIIHSWQKVDPTSVHYMPEMTPLVLAAQKNNYEILKLLLDRGASLPMPHDIRCGCEVCLRSATDDPLLHSSIRINEYRALASPNLIVLSSPDPLMTAFQLSSELKELASSEPESKSDYLKLKTQVERFAVDLLQQVRTSSELSTILNHDYQNQTDSKDVSELAKLRLALEYDQKEFVAHAHIQQLLATIWYEGVPGFRKMSKCKKSWIIIKTAVLFPVYCFLYFVAPYSSAGQLMRRPFMKFLIHSSSYLFFLIVLILVSQRADTEMINLFKSNEEIKGLQGVGKQRGVKPSPLEYIIVIYVLGFIWEEIREVFVKGLHRYLHDLWNFIDFTRNILYVATIILRVVAYFEQVSEIKYDSSAAFIPRERWYDFDYQLIAEGLFAAANIFSALKLVHMCSINPHLGPLQVSLGRMVIDIIQIFFIYTLVLFAFACGLNQLLWYFAELEKQKCYRNFDSPDWDSGEDSCIRWRRFSNLFESCQSLFWASFGDVGIESFELHGIKSYTRFWGLLMFGSYSVINVIVLLNLLIAMMSNSYSLIKEHADTEWKFARTKLWMNYFEEKLTLPPPFNIFPPPKLFLRLFRIQKESEQKKDNQRRTRTYKYGPVMRALSWRYVVYNSNLYSETKSATEDDCRELKSDMSSWRCELLDILKRNGMDVNGADAKEKNKKMKNWERRLIKDFQMVPSTELSDEDQMQTGLQLRNEDTISKWRRVSKMVAHDPSEHQWAQVLDGAKSSQIGKSTNKTALEQKENLRQAMAAAERLVARSPLPPGSPISLKDTGAVSSIIPILQDNEKSKTFLKPIVAARSSPNPVNQIFQRDDDAAFDYVDEKNRKSPSITKRVSNRWLRKKEPSYSRTSNCENRSLTPSPHNHRKECTIKNVILSPRKIIDKYSASSYASDDVVKPKPRSAISPRRVPEISIIPTTPELKQAEHNIRKVHKIEPKSPRLYLRSPRKGWL